MQKLQFHHQTKQEVLHPYFRLHCQDWVTIVAITIDGDTLFVKQPRAGTIDYSLETPGGMIDNSDSDNSVSALRELEEETGYTSSNIVSLGAINPNPALFDNMLHMYLALDCVIQTSRTYFPDPEEEIELIKIPWTAVRNNFIGVGVNSALSALAILQASINYPSEK